MITDLRKSLLAALLLCMACQNGEKARAEAAAAAEAQARATCRDLIAKHIVKAGMTDDQCVTQLTAEGL